ncbi:hypothetical protein AVEN_58424-1 [Araneus ventricosus]|uniref:Uncharacterized protein n=1 Tax=Araneus ventricosus TaxID=182803 RepID=A0A4Y2N025_ARAVE|nr:hypothetical protein AVEN_58424-1 [Araneus ventricosus]
MVTSVIKNYILTLDKKYKRERLGRNPFPDKYLEPIFGVKSGLYGGGVAPDFELELLQQFLSFASRTGIAMQEDDTITQHVMAFEPDGFIIVQ